MKDYNKRIEEEKKMKIDFGAGSKSNTEKANTEKANTEKANTADEWHAPRGGEVRTIRKTNSDIVKDSEKATQEKAAKFNDKDYKATDIMRTIKGITKEEQVLRGQIREALDTVKEASSSFEKEAPGFWKNMFGYMGQTPGVSGTNNVAIGTEESEKKLNEANIKITIMTKRLDQLNKARTIEWEKINKIDQEKKKKSSEESEAKAFEEAEKKYFPEDFRKGPPEQTDEEKNMSERQRLSVEEAKAKKSEITVTKEATKVQKKYTSELSDVQKEAASSYARGVMSTSAGVIPMGEKAGIIGLGSKSGLKGFSSKPGVKGIGGHDPSAVYAAAAAVADTGATTVAQRNSAAFGGGGSGYHSSGQATALERENAQKGKDAMYGGSGDTPKVEVTLKLGHNLEMQHKEVNDAVRVKVIR
jgi:hypothetical protein